jgi:hypothetical protein
LHICPFLVFLFIVVKTGIMPVESKYPLIQIPDVGIWDLLFRREQLPFPKDKSKIIVIQVLE